MKDTCEEKQDVLDEQVSYIKYLDTEYDVRPWKATDDVIVVSESDNHREIKNKLDTEVRTAQLSFEIEQLKSSY